LSSSERLNVPLVSSLVPDGIRPGTILVTEFDPESHWFAVATTIAARYVQDGCKVDYLAMARPREDVRSDLARLGLNVPAAEEARLLRVDDWYSATLGLGPTSRGVVQEIQENRRSYLRIQSLKVSDLSVEWLKDMKRTSEPGVVEEFFHLVLAESISPGLRFNEEKAYLEWFESRVNPDERRQKRLTLQGIVRGIHNESFYRRMENAADGVIEVRIMDRDEEAKNFLRIRGLKGQRYNARWHEIQVKPNGETVLLSN